MSSSPASTQELRTRRLAWLTLALYLAFIVYQTLAGGGVWACNEAVLAFPRRLSRSDVLANVVAYMPIGLLAVLAWRGGSASRGRVWMPVLVGSSGAAALSLGLEVTQACQPGRVSSAYDWIANSVGAVLGAGLAVAIVRHGRLPVAAASGAAPEAARLRRLRLLTAGVAAAWIVSQTVPWVFAVDVGTVRGNLSFLRRWGGASTLDVWQLVRHAGAWLAIASACRVLTRDTRHAVAALALALAASFGLQLLVDTGRPLSYEELIGVTLGCLVVLATWVVLAAPPVSRTTAVLLAAGTWMAVAAYELRPDPTDTVRAFSWWPRVGLGGLRGAIDYALLFGWFGLSTVVAAAWAGQAGVARAEARWPAAAIVSMLVFEVLQTGIPGRGPDVSAPLFTALAVLSTMAILGVRGGGDPPMPCAR